MRCIGAGNQRRMLATWSLVREVVLTRVSNQPITCTPAHARDSSTPKSKEPSDEPIGWNRYRRHCPISGRGALLRRVIACGGNESTSAIHAYAPHPQRD